MCVLRKERNARSVTRVGRYSQEMKGRGNRKAAVGGSWLGVGTNLCIGYERYLDGKILFLIPYQLVRFSG